MDRRGSQVARESRRPRGGEPSERSLDRANIFARRFALELVRSRGRDRRRAQIDLDARCRPGFAPNDVQRRAEHSLFASRKSCTEAKAMGEEAVGTKKGALLDSGGLPRRPTGCELGRKGQVGERFRDCRSLGLKEGRDGEHALAIVVGEHEVRFEVMIEPRSSYRSSSPR